MKIKLSELKKIIKEEGLAHNEKLGDKPRSVEDAAKDTEEKDASEMADSLEHPVDWMKALDIKERKARRYLKKIREEKAKVRRIMAKK